MDNKLAIIFIFSVSYALGMDTVYTTTKFSPIVLESTLEIPMCNYYIAGYPSESIRTKTNQIFGYDIVKKNDICLPLVLTPNFKQAHQQISMIPLGIRRFFLEGQLQDIEKNSDSPIMIALPIHTLQSNCSLKDNTFYKYHGLFLTSYTFNQHQELQDTIKELESKSAHIFEYKEKTKSWDFDIQTSRRIFALEKDGLTQCDAMLNNCLHEKEDTLQDLLQKKLQMHDTNQDTTNITEEINYINTTSVFDFYDIPQYQKLCSLNSIDDHSKKSMVVFETPHFLNKDIEGNVRRRHIEHFQKKQERNIFNIIHDREKGLKSFNVTREQ